MSNGAMSAMSAFCTRWKSRRRFAAIVSIGELSDAAMRTSPVTNDAMRQPFGRSRRAARAYATAAVAVSTR
jgi:hypothetical protein